MPAQPISAVESDFLQRFVEKINNFLNTATSSMRLWTFGSENYARNQDSISDKIVDTNYRCLQSVFLTEFLLFVFLGWGHL